MGGCGTGGRDGAGNSGSGAGGVERVGSRVGWKGMQVKKCNIITKAQKKYIITERYKSGGRVVKAGSVARGG